jgi:phosphotransferase system enzyme I (PtsI)
MTVVAQGNGVSPGVALGRAVLLHVEPLPVVAEPIPPERVDAEVETFRATLEAATGELEQLTTRVSRELGESYAGIFDAQRLVLADPQLVEGTVQRIRVGRVAARWALREVVDGLTRRFGEMDDPYLRERGGELVDVHRRLQRLLRGESAVERALDVEGPVVVIAHSVGPSDAVFLADNQVAGLATDVGGPTSHTAILAQALSIPAVVGVHDLSRRVRAGDPVILDGDSGQVIVAPDASETADAERRRAALLTLEAKLEAAGERPSVTRDGKQIVLRATIEFGRELERAKGYGAQGIGLYRSEFLFLSRAPGVPDEAEHGRRYSEICEAVAPEPVVVRTLDLGGEKYFHGEAAEEAVEPALGLRGIRLCLRRPDIFLPQVRGLLRAAAKHDNLRVMLPLVSVAAEIRQMRCLFLEQAELLREEGVEARADFPLGVMVEVPAAALAADLLAEEADFFAIGTNDLIQYTLAVDRASEALADHYQPNHPGLLRLIRMVVQAGRRAGIPVSVCGEMAADPRQAAVLVGLGLRELSVQPRAVAPVREAIRELTLPECELRVAELLDDIAVDWPATS